MHRGYYQNPTLHRDQITFLCEEDLWTISTLGGEARRLTAGRGGFQAASYSPDGEWLAVASSEFGGRDIYVMPSDGGELRRLTWFNQVCTPRGWWKNHVVFSTMALDGNLVETLATVPADGGEVKPLNLGPGLRTAQHKDGTLVFERNMWRSDSSHWKRYRGGTAGKFYLRPKGSKTFKPFLRQLKGNLSHPMWIGERLYFLSDHEGIANLFSVSKSGGGLRRHTTFRDYYVRNPDSDGERIVFHSAGDLYLFDPAAESVRRIDVRVPTQRTQRQPRLLPATPYLETYNVDASGSRLALVSRGQVFAFGAWQGPVLSPSRELKQTARDRLATFLGRDQLLFTTDELGDERLVLADWENPAKRKIIKADVGRVVRLVPSPDASKIALSNHRNEILVLDVKTEKVRVVHGENAMLVSDFSWSPDSRYLAFVASVERIKRVVRLWDAKDGRSRDVTREGAGFQAVRFGPTGDTLYCLGAINFNPRYENVRFSLYFERHQRPLAVLLNHKTQSPLTWIETTTAPATPGEDGSKKKNTKGKDPKAPPATLVDWDGITERMVEIPALDLEYADLKPTDCGLILVHYNTPPAKNFNQKIPWSLDKYDFATRKQTSLYCDIDAFEFSSNYQYVLLKKGETLRLRKVTEAGTEDKADTGCHPKSGLIDLSRVMVPVIPANEWVQIFEETWRLQEHFFWEKGLGGVDWRKERAKYRPLVDRVSTRNELSDICWELVGELGVSHAYVGGGDVRFPPSFQLGFLGADVSWDAKAGGYRVLKIFKGYPWASSQSSPLRQGAVQMNEGDVILAVNRQPCRADISIGEQLVGLAGKDVELEILRRGVRATERMLTRTLDEDMTLRYRDWVETNRQRVHRLSKGKLGYVHIPDMGPDGYAEFFEQYLQDYDRDGLIVDVRFNGGGHVSPLIISRLLQKRIGFDQSRWFGTWPYPQESPAGPIVGLTNEFAGSDGDIFSHSFKLYGLGPLIGTRTWGGVIGIWPRHTLIDGGRATQPEFAFWFTDVGWDVEGHGTEPDIAIDNMPHDFIEDRDPQLEKSVIEALRLVRKSPPLRPQNVPLPKRAYKPKKAMP